MGRFQVHSAKCASKGGQSHLCDCHHAIRISPMDKMMRADGRLCKALDAMRGAVRDTSQLIRDIQHKGVK